MAIGREVDFWKGQRVGYNRSPYDEANPSASAFKV